MIDKALFNKNFYHLSQSLVKEPDEAGLKKNFKAVNNFLEELVKIGKVFVAFLFTRSRKLQLIDLSIYIFLFIVLKLNRIPCKYISDFPGSKPVSEASSKFGPALVSGQVFYVFEKVSTFIGTEENKEKVEAPPTTTKTEEETSAIKERETVVEEEKKEEEKSQEVETTEKTESAEPPAAPKVEEQPSKEEEKSAESVAVEKAEQPAVTKVEEQPGTEPSKVEEKPAEPAAVEKAEPPKP